MEWWTRLIDGRAAIRRERDRKNVLKRVAKEQFHLAEERAFTIEALQGLIVRQRSRIADLEGLNQHKAARIDTLQAELSVARNGGVVDYEKRCAVPNPQPRSG